MSHDMLCFQSKSKRVKGFHSQLKIKFKFRKTQFVSDIRTAAYITKIEQIIYL